MEVNIYIGFWNLKMKCIPYGLYEPPTLNPKSTLLRSTFSDRTRSDCARLYLVVQDKISLAAQQNFRR